MTQAKFVVPSKGFARVIIKTHSQDELPVFELDWEMTKQQAEKLMIYAMQLKAKEEESNER